MTHPVWVVGVSAEGPDGLAPDVRRRIEEADELWGSRRLLAYWPDYRGLRVIIGADRTTRDVAAELVERALSRGERRIAVLASGDPGFYGIAGTLLRHLPPGDVEIVPAVGMLPLAFARAGIAWSDAILTSAHARSLAEVVGWAKRAPKLGILTDPKQTPAVIARTLLDAGLPDCQAVVAENLCAPEERVTTTRLSALPAMAFADLNVLLLIQDAGWKPRPAFAPRPDEAYAHRAGLITKADVRALSLARLALRETDCVWDIGAGSGALSVEMAELAWRGQVFAVEQDAENLGYIRENVRRFGAVNVVVVEGRAPEALAELPPPSAVFIGGTGGEMKRICVAAGQRASGRWRVVMNLATLEHLNEALHLMRALRWSPQLTQVSLAQGKPVGRDHAGSPLLTRLAPLNPVFILSAEVE